jgi:hypothetical protein
VILPLLLAQLSCPTLADIPPPNSCSISDGGCPSCAPGATETDDLAVICHQSTTARRCAFDAAFRRRMAKAYGVESCGEIDHRVSLELGGSNEVANLWCEPAPEFHQKDAVEDSLHAAVCRGDLSLDAARVILLERWREYYAGMRRKKRGLP